jgi:hypothetical protein
MTVTTPRNQIARDYRQLKTGKFISWPYHS